MYGYLVQYRHPFKSFVEIFLDDDDGCYSRSSLPLSAKDDTGVPRHVRQEILNMTYLIQYRAGASPLG
jgi:hypothetical protein